VSRKPDLQVPAPHLAPEKADEVLAELERVLASTPFRASRRCQGLLRRVVEQSLAGDVDSLKERSLGAEVFGRPVDYDTSQDPVVRASAAEIRKKLAQYYQEAGHESHVRIEMPSGSYLADFHFITEAPAPAPAAAEAKPETKPPRKHTLALALGIVALVCLVSAVAWLSTARWERSDLDDLWGPVLKNPGSVLVCVGLQAAYNLRSAQAQDEVQGIIQAPAPTKARRPMREEDLVLLKDRYLALDDALCLVRVTTLLERHQKAYRIRAERSTSFADLRDTPAVLIGAFDNPWTLRAASQLRFTFSKDSANDTGTVHDRQNPANTSWKLSNYWPNWDIPVDYAIVTRMVDTTSDRPVIIAAGLTQYGTIGAGEFLTKQEYFSEAVPKLPKDWAKKNLQIVLSVPVVNRISGRPRILAVHVW
jgi:hypothetical protein